MKLNLTPKKPAEFELDYNYPSDDGWEFDRFDTANIMHLRSTQAYIEFDGVVWYAEGFRNQVRSLGSQLNTARETVRHLSMQEIRLPKPVMDEHDRLVKLTNSLERQVSTVLEQRDVEIDRARELEAKLEAQQKETDYWRNLAFSRGIRINNARASLDGNA